MQSTFSYYTISIIILFGLFGIYAIGHRIYWFFNKEAHQRELAALREKLEELKPTDPEYNQARALYNSMMIDAHRLESSHSSMSDSASQSHNVDVHDSGHSGSDVGSDGGGHH